MAAMAGLPVMTVRNSLTHLQRNVNLVSRNEAQVQHLLRQKWCRGYLLPPPSRQQYAMPQPSAISRWRAGPLNSFRSCTDGATTAAFDNHHFQLTPGLIQGLANIGVVAPNATQALALPAAATGDDVLVVSQTGSGKTLTFLLPLLVRLASKKLAAHEMSSTSCNPNHPKSRTHSGSLDTSKGSDSGVQVNAVIVAPTEELVAQHAAVAQDLVQWLPHPPQVVVSTAAELLQQHNNSRGRDLRREAVLLVATPAELVKLPRLVGLEVAVLDEVDALLCGPAFEADLSAAGTELLAILSSARGNLPRLQWLLATAYLDTAHAVALTARFPAATRVDQAAGDRAVLVPGLKQVFHYCGADSGAAGKAAKLVQVLQRAALDPFLAGGTTLVFCASPAAATAVAAAVQAALPELRAEALHEGQPAATRVEAVRNFRAADPHGVRVLAATQQVARGLDFPALRHVVMFDVSDDIGTFVHSVGRTARQGRRGQVTCLVQGRGGRGHIGLHALGQAPKLHFEPVPACPYPAT